VGAATAQSIVGNPNTYTPYGSQTYSIAGYEQVPDAQGRMQNVPRYNMTQSLSPDQQQLLGYETQTKGNIGLTGTEQSERLRGHLNTPVDTTGRQGWAGQTNQATDRQGIENAMMASYNRQRQPQMQAENAQLAARGLSPGGKGFGQVQQGREDAFGEAARQAYLASGAESREASGFLNNLRNQQLQEQLAVRNQPINEVMALLGGSGVTLPQFQGYQGQGINQAQPGNYMGQNYQIAAQSANAFNSGLFGMAGSLLGGLGTAASDRRLKQDIVPLGAKLAGVPLYEFRYRADPETIHIGVMADEARPLHPDVVMTIGGYDHVDYAKLQSRHDGGL
jgi:hypothetical protein